MVGKLSAKGRKLVTIVDPHIKRDDNYHIYKELKEKDLFVKRDGSEFDGWCWPGIISIEFVISQCLMVGSCLYL